MAIMRKGSPVPRWARAKIAELFGADLRSLAAFRVVLAVLVLGDLASRATDLTAHYTDAGVLPRSVLLEGVLSRWSFSLSLVSGEPFFQAFLFGAAALAAIGLLVGYRTRLMSVLVWVLLVSIQWRNPLVLTSAENLLRILLFWGMFLPLGACWSVDRARNAAPPRLSMRFLSFATVGLFGQIVLVYWFTALLKSGPEWRVDGTAIYYTLSIDQITTPTGAYLYQFPELLRVLTFATIGLEAFGPFLLFFPFFTGPVRTAAVLAFMSLHFGIWLTLYIGIFPWVAALCMVCFLPAWFWDEALPKLGAALPRQAGISRRLRPPAARMARAYWSPLRARLSAVAGARRLSVAAPAASPPGTQGRGEEGSTTAATGGQKLAPDGTASSGEPVTTLRSSLLTNLLALFFLLYVFCWNLSTVSEFRVPERLVPIGYFLGIGQMWDMFAPYPIKDVGWYVIPGTLSGGQRLDLMSVTREDFRVREGVSWEKPRNVPGIYKNDRWRTYLERLRLAGDNEQFLLHFGRYICREWNARHSGAERLTDFQITYMLETTLPDYEPSTPREMVLWEHRC